MTTAGWLPTPTEDLFGPDATAEETYDVLTVDVPPTAWTTALETARDRLDCTYFDWLSAVDEPGTGFRVAAHVVALSPVRRLLVRTTVPHDAPVLASAVGVYAGAAWHERETHEMFGVVFQDHPALDHLLLPDGFEGHPLRKDFVLAARVAKAWPGAKEPGESEHGGPKRRQMLPPGVPDPNEWGPLKGQLPPAPARPARGAAGRAAGERPTRAAAGDRPVRAAGDRPARAAGERPARRTRSAAEGSVSQSADTPSTTPSATNARASADAPAPADTPASADTPISANAPASADTSASATGVTGVTGVTGATGGTGGTGGTGRTASTAPTDRSAQPAQPAPRSTSGPRRSRSASEGSASQRTPAPAETTPDQAPSPSPRSSDAPWHHARPAFDDEPDPRGTAVQRPAPAEQPSGDDGTPADEPRHTGSRDTASREDERRTGEPPADESRPPTDETPENRPGGPQ
ncbi:NADH-quinone oxidoreductase subunit C [Streptomyces sp. NPDC088812]|uniref:NADH-quinone oxidoreductase subunit C n=1 Tax=Streptomyces sp. NPDC088812 TaxID=3365905 RepID=UPI00380D405A